MQQNTRLLQNFWDDYRIGTRAAILASLCRTDRIKWGKHKIALDAAVELRSSCGQAKRKRKQQLLKQSWQTLTPFRCCRVIRSDNGDLQYTELSGQGKQSVKGLWLCLEGFSTSLGPTHITWKQDCQVIGLLCLLKLN